MNFLVSHVTRKAPIKVTQRKGYKDRESGRYDMSITSNNISKFHLARAFFGRQIETIFIGFQQESME